MGDQVLVLLKRAWVGINTSGSGFCREKSWHGRPEFLEKSKYLMNKINLSFLIDLRSKAKLCRII
jgi:hypothetical protein